LKKLFFDKPREGFPWHSLISLSNSKLFFVFKSPTLVSRHPCRPLGSARPCAELRTFEKSKSKIC